MMLPRKLWFLAVATCFILPSLAFVPTICTQQSEHVSAYALGAVALPVNEGNLRVNRRDEELKLAYRIVRPMSLSSLSAAPILVLHGGPGIPSDYLYPLADVVPYRSIVYYDQIGCGKSSEPQDTQAYSIEYALDDLEALTKNLGLRRFHLYGQSFGGILAFEYMKRAATRNDNSDCTVLSAVLSSAPTNVSLVEEEANRLISVLAEETDHDPSKLQERFRLEHQCRTLEKPQALVDAFAHAGTVWRGSSVIQEYVAIKPPDGVQRMPSALVLRGEHDFCTEDCIAGWKHLFNHNFVRQRTLEGCSHHGLLEDPEMYGDLVDSYFAEYD